jgi:bleomycin hydrolase
MKNIFFIALLLTGSYAFAQQPQRDQIETRPYKPGYFDNDILKGIEQFEGESKTPAVKKPAYKIDVSKLSYYPKSVDEFTTWWKNKPVSQGNTGTCWAYSSTSFFETEVYRMSKKEVKISEMYTAYWEYVDKARRFIRERGNSHFDEGSEGNGLVRIYKTYGCVPLEAYSGMLPGQSFHAHEKMTAEMRTFLNGLKTSGNWNEEAAIGTIRSILNHYMGEPPAKVKVNGKDITPKQYLTDVLKLNMDDYIDLVSLKSKPYWTKMEYEVPDNWWHDSSYYNVPLEDFMTVVNTAIRQGYTMMIGGDVSEPGFDAWNQIAVVPTFDIPSEYIDENARFIRFANGTTTDDHGMHLVGFLEKEGKLWYLVKDSGAGSRNCGKESANFGFYFMHEDYLKLKMMDVLLHKDMVKDLLKRFKA